MGTGGGIIFRGSGFYQTDYRSESYKRAAEAEKSGGKSTGEAKGTESKPAKSEKTEKAEKAGSKAKPERKAG